MSTRSYVTSLFEPLNETNCLQAQILIKPTKKFQMKFSSQEWKVGDFNRNMINLLREDSSFFPVWVSHDFWERLGSVQLIL